MHVYNIPLIILNCVLPKYAHLLAFINLIGINYPT